MGLLLQKIKLALRTRTEKKRAEILEAKQKLDKSLPFGEKMDGYYGGWLDALDWFEGR